jgi:hypothetical protein
MAHEGRQRIYLTILFVTAAVCPFSHTFAANPGDSVFVAILYQGPAWIAQKPLQEQPEIGLHAVYQARLGDRLIASGSLAPLAARG